MARTKILLVEFSNYVGAILRKKLQELDCDVRTTRDFAKLPGVIEDFRPDILIMDIVDVQSFQLCESLRANHQTAALPIVIHTSNASLHLVESALRSGTDHYVKKPASFEALWARVEKAVKRRNINATITRGRRPDVVQRFLAIQDPDIRLEFIASQASDMMAIPHAVARALQLAQSPTSSAQDVATVIESDAALSAAVLKHANSAFFASGKPITDVRNAIVRVGFNETKKLVLGMSVVSAFEPQGKALGFSRMGFWEHSLGTALYASQVARAGNRVPPEDAFTAGLLHGIGKIILDDTLDTLFEQAIDTAHSRNMPLADAEREVLGLTHGEVGRALLANWKLPVSLQNIAGCGGELPRADAGLPAVDAALGTVVFIAANLARAHGLFNAGDRMLQDLTPAILKEAGITATFADEIAAKVQDEIQSFKSFLAIGDDDVMHRNPLAAFRGELAFVDMEKKPLNVYSWFLKRMGVILRQPATPADAAALLRAATPETGARLAILDAGDTIDFGALLGELPDLLEAGKAALLCSAEARRTVLKKTGEEIMPMLAKPLNAHAFATQLESLLR